MRDKLTANGLLVLGILLAGVILATLLMAVNTERAKDDAGNIERLRRLERKINDTLNKQQDTLQKREQENQTLKNDNGQLKQENDTLHNEVGRVYSLRDYLASHGSPMADYAADIYKSGKRHGVDPKVIVAIAYIESTLGKANGLKDGWSVWGWSGRLDTSSTEALIDSYTRAIAREYPGLAKGDIASARSYCVPPESWIANVTSVYAELEAKGV